MLHSKKSHKGNWEKKTQRSPIRSRKWDTLHSKKSHKGNWEGDCSALCFTLKTYSSCIRRNPTKGIESIFSPPYILLFYLVLHSKKSHKGNWELNNLFHRTRLPSMSSCIRRNPTKGIESGISLGSSHSSRSSSCIRRNPTKGIERAYQVSLSRLENFYGLHSKKSHKGNWELVSITIASPSALALSCIRRNPTKGIESQSHS